MKARPLMAAAVVLYSLVLYRVSYMRPIQGVIYERSHKVSYMRGHFIIHYLH
jgi:hypothetical protein